MKAKKLLNMNMVGLVFLTAAFAVSLYRVMTLTKQTTSTDNQKIVTILHWQLEAGYRASLDRVIAEYNNLPRVKAAGVIVRQMGVTERVYSQFLNIHLLSGTAPDLSEKGMASMTGGDYTGRFYEPLSNYATAPNPYNNEQTLPKDMDPELRKVLETSPWRDTFVDGMRGGWDDKLQDYYAVPTSLFGAIRLYYNIPMFAQAKGMIRQAMAAEPRPKWFADVILHKDAEGKEAGFVTLDEGFGRWAASDEVPNTLGRLMVLCRAIRQMSMDIGNSKLVPISGSLYSANMFGGQFVVPFTYSMSEQLDFNGDSSVTAMEAYAGYQRGVWNFKDPRIVGYFDCVRAICEQFPVGFLGLDREQAMRRFADRNASMIATGAWDAGGIFQQAEGVPVTDKTRIYPGDTVTEVNGVKRLNFKFKVGIMPFPMPATGERWGNVTTHVRISEAGTNAGASYALYQRSRNKEWAIDFLQYLTSYSVNQKFNRGADWIPCIVGTTPAGQMRPFTPNPQGVTSGARLEFAAGGANFWTVFQGQLWNYELGEIPYDQLVGQVIDAMNNDRTGLARYWYDTWDKDRAATRNQDRMLAVYAMRMLTQPDADAMAKYKRGLLASVIADNGTKIKQMWHAQFPDKPFPQF
ncbi:MAG: hypothetical protein ACYC26_04825 [Phycisphaerales bacterium]